MLRILFMLGVLFVECNLLKAQIIHQNYTLSEDSLQIGEKMYLPHRERGYTLYLPEEKKADGLIICLNDGAYKPLNMDERAIFHSTAIKQNLAVLYISTGIPVDLYLGKSSQKFAARLLRVLLNQYDLPSSNHFYVGAMLEGHRAFRLIEHCKVYEPPLYNAVAGVIVSESVLDWVRMWYEGVKQVRDHLNDTKYFEGNFITYMLSKHLDGSPQDNMEAYLRFSPYSYFDPENRKPPLYSNFAIRAYTFAPTNYWYSSNGTGIYDCNFPDMSGLINEQVLQGNENAELIVFTNEKRATVKEMEKQTDTWLLVDKAEMIEWMLKLIKE